MVILFALLLMLNPISTQDVLTLPKEVEFIKLDEKISSRDWNKYNSILFPAEGEYFQKELKAGVSTQLADQIIYEKSTRGYSKKQRVLCFYLSDVTNTMLCLFQTNAVQMAVTGRAMLYAWASVELDSKVSVFTDSVDDICDTNTKNKVCSYMQYIGADLRGVDLKKVGEKIKKAPFGIEQDFYNKIIYPELYSKGANFVLITALSSGWILGEYTVDLSSLIVLHEALHSIYFMNKKVRDIVDAHIEKELKNKDSDVNVLLKWLRSHKNSVYPEIDSDKYLRNNELFAKLMIPEAHSKEECVKVDVLNKRIAVAVELKDKINAAGVKLPDIWQKVISSFETSVEGETCFQSGIINGYCNPSYAPCFLDAARLPTRSIKMYE